MKHEITKHLDNLDQAITVMSLAQFGRTPGRIDRLRSGIRMAEPELRELRKLVESAVIRKPMIERVKFWKRGSK